MFVDDEIRAKAQELAAKRNDSLEQKARRANAMQFAAKHDLIDYLLGRVTQCFRCMRQGVLPEMPLKDAADVLVQVLSTPAYLVFRGCGVDDFVSENELDDAGKYVGIPEDLLVKCTVEAWTDEFGLWENLVKALGEYLYMAATVAKAANSTAARLYLRAWQILQERSAREKGFYELRPEEAQRLVNLETVAYDRLWVDMQLAALPKFKAGPGAGKGTSKKV